MQRVELHGDGWCFGMAWFVMAALFEKTGYADWTLESAGLGNRYKQTDGESHQRFWAWRTLKEKGNGQIMEIQVIPVFDVYGNGYSYQSIFRGALAALPQISDHNIEHLNCRDEQAIPGALSDAGLVKEA